jgi:hypothetical protein
LGSSQTLLKGGLVTLKNGVDLVARVVNKVSPNTTLTKAAYQVVKVSGAQGQRLAVDLAQANNDNNSADTLGVVTETIAPNQEGFILTVGQLENINTTGSLQGETWADGNVLYLSPTVAGRITNVKPTGATGHIVIIGYVEYAHVNNGKIYVKIMNGWELDELHNVYINTGTLANNNALIYESSTQLWKNKTIATALGFTPENVANKSDSFTASSSTTYASTKALVDAFISNGVVLAKTPTTVVFTGVVTERCFLVIPLPVGTDNYHIRVIAFARANVTLSSMRLRIGTTASPIDGNVGATAIGNQTQIALYTHTNSNRVGFVRNIIILGGASGSRASSNSGTTILGDEGVGASIITTATLNTTVQNYIYLSYDLTNSAADWTLQSAFATALKLN